MRERPVGTPFQPLQTDQPITIQDPLAHAPILPKPPTTASALAPDLSRMNYLAHLFLAENTPASRIGNLLGDFVTGRPESIELPPDVVAGIVRHRAVDRFTDDFPAIIQARNCFIGPRRRFANPLVDICLDHFLARRWAEFHPLPLPSFLDTAYREQREHRAWLPPALAESIDERIADNWLGHYGTEEGLQQTFDRVAARRPAFKAISRSMDDFRAHREPLADAFDAFFPALIEWNTSLGPERLAVTPSPTHD